MKIWHVEFSLDVHHGLLGKILATTKLTLLPLAIVGLNRASENCIMCCGLYIETFLSFISSCSKIFWNEHIAIYALGLQGTMPIHVMYGKLKSFDWFKTFYKIKKKRQNNKKSVWCLTTDVFILFCPYSIYKQKLAGNILEFATVCDLKFIKNSMYLHKKHSIIFIAFLDWYMYAWFDRV